MTLAEWNKVIETNLTGTFLCAQAAGRNMLQQESGKIINMGSGGRHPGRASGDRAGHRI